MGDKKVFCRYEVRATFKPKTHPEYTTPQVVVPQGSSDNIVITSGAPNDYQFIDKAAAVAFADLVAQMDDVIYTYVLGYFATGEAVRVYCTNELMEQYIEVHDILARAIDKIAKAQGYTFDKIYRRKLGVLLSGALAHNWAARDEQEGITGTSRRAFYAGACKEFVRAFTWGLDDE